MFAYLVYWWVCCFYCRLKAIVLTFWAENQSFRNKSGKAQSIRTKFGIRGHVEGWQLSGNFWLDRPIWATWGLGRVLQSTSFFCVVIQTSFQQLCNGQFLPNLATKRNSLSRRGIWKDNFQTFLLLGSFAPKSEIKSRSNRHLTQDMGCTAERYCLLHVVVQGPDSFWDRSTFLYDVWLQSYEASKLPNFRTSAHFSHTKLLKRTLQWPAYSPGFTSQNDYDFSMW